MEPDVRLLHQVTRIPPVVIIEPASNVLLDPQSLPSDVFLDWSATWTRDLVRPMPAPIVVPHDTITAKDLQLASSVFRKHIFAVDGISPRHFAVLSMYALNTVATLAECFFAVGEPP